MKIFTKLAIAAVLAASLSMPALADEKDNPTASRAPLSTQDFVKMATVSNNFEISSSRLALQKSKSANVKKFAQTMIDDHSKVAASMKPIVAASNLEGAMPDDKLDEKHQAVYDDLKNTSAANFDMKYLAAQEDAHKEAIMLFKDYSMDGGDANLKQFAGNTLPSLEAHQKMLMDMHPKK